jgi:hypothetical protein
MVVGGPPASLAIRAAWADEWTIRAGRTVEVPRIALQ